MFSFIIMSVGLGLVIWSLYSIRKDIERGNLELTKGLSGVSDHNLERIVKYLDELEKQMNGMNEAFYDLISDLEGSYSIHEKEISLMVDRLCKLEKQTAMLTSDVRIETQAADLKDPKKVRAYQKNEMPYKAEEPSRYKSEEKAPYFAEEPIEVPKMLGLSPSEAIAMKQRILALRKEGKNISQIAKELNVGIGELQLFIKLNTK